MILKSKKEAESAFSLFFFGKLTQNIVVFIKITLQLLPIFNKL